MCIRDRCLNHHKPSSSFYLIHVLLYGLSPPTTHYAVWTATKWWTILFFLSTVVLVSVLLPPLSSKPHYLALFPSTIFLRPCSSTTSQNFKVASLQFPQSPGFWVTCSHAPNKILYKPLSAFQEHVSGRQKTHFLEKAPLACAILFFM